MGRIRTASEHFSRARRNLIESYIEGETSALLAAMRDAAAGLKALERVAITSASATASVEVLRVMIPQQRPEVAWLEQLESFDRTRFSCAVDELASWLFFSTQGSH